MYGGVNICGSGGNAGGVVAANIGGGIGGGISGSGGGVSSNPVEFIANNRITEASNES